MVLRSSLFVALALTVLALAYSLQLVGPDARACKDPAGAARIEACTRVIASANWNFDNRSWAYFSRGDAYREKGETDLALADYDKSIELEPKRSIVYHNRALAYQDKNDLDRAIVEYSEAIGRFHLRKPQSKRDFLVHRAAAYQLRGDLGPAVADYDAAIHLVQHDTNLYLNRGLVFKAMNDLDRSIADFTHAIDEFDPAKNSLADKRNYLTARAEAYAAKGEAGLALADHHQVAAIDATLARPAKARARVASR